MQYIVGRFGCHPSSGGAVRWGSSLHEILKKEKPLTANDGSDAPLILTLKMDDGSQERFDRLREAHFPPERNYLSAHLTLFHHLPGDREGEVVEDIEDACGGQAPITLRASGLLFMGRGVAYKLEAPELVGLRRRLSKVWGPFLTKQDQQGLRPHVTVQNKVPPEEARALHHRLEGSFSPFEVRGEGLLLWRYLGGPWKPVGAYPFTG